MNQDFNSSLSQITIIIRHWRHLSRFVTSHPLQTSLLLFWQHQIFKNVCTEMSSKNLFWDISLILSLSLSVFVCVSVSLSQTHHYPLPETRLIFTEDFPSKAHVLKAPFPVWHYWEEVETLRFCSTTCFCHNLHPCHRPKNMGWGGAIDNGLKPTKL